MSYNWNQILSKAKYHLNVMNNYKDNIDKFIEHEILFLYWHCILDKYFPSSYVGSVYEDMTHREIYLLCLEKFKEFISKEYFETLYFKNR